MALLSNEDLAALAGRMGRETLELRLSRERQLVRKKSGAVSMRKDSVIDACLRAAGLAGVAHRNFLDVRVVENRVLVPGLPGAFDGFRLTQITDLHCDLEPELMDVVEATMSGITCDAVVLTGDYHDHIGHGGGLSLELMLRLISKLPHPRFCVFGNHDFLSRVAVFERAGLPVLLNEHATIARGGQQIHVCGVDDPRFFRTHDLARARLGIPPGSITILLAHSPQVAEEAAALGYSLMLCGHTHGGQLCLPGGIPVLRNAPVPYRLLGGPWIVNGMPGYTSRGTGACGVAARLFCPPEITIHVLVKSG